MTTIAKVLPALRNRTAAAPLTAERQRASVPVKGLLYGVLAIGVMAVLACGLLMASVWAGQPHPVGDALGTTGGVAIFGGACAAMAIAAFALAELDDEQIARL